MSNGYDFWLVENDINDGYLTKHIDAHRANQVEVDAAASEQLRQDAAVGRALREMKAHVHISLMSPLPGDATNTDCFEVVVTDKARFLVSYTGATPYAALVAAGMIEEEK